MLAVAETKEDRCKGCGLQMQPGYARCPRCTMPQPASGRPKREATIMGGTAVEGGANRSTFIALGLLLGVVLIVLIMGRDGEKKSAPELPTRSDLETAPRAAVPAQVTQPDTSAPGTIGFVVDESADKAKDGKKALTIELQATLSRERFWSTVSVDREQNSRIIVSSGSCREAAMKALLAGNAVKLREAGFTTLRCVEKHGALVYERAL